MVDTRLSLSFRSSSLSSSCAPPQRPRAVRSVLRHHPVPVLLPPFSLPHPRHILAPGASYYHPFLLIPHEALFPKPPFAPLSALPIHSNTPPALRASGFTLLSFLTRLTPSPTLTLSSSSCNPSLLFPFLTSSFSPPLSSLGQCSRINLNHVSILKHHISPLHLPSSSQVPTHKVQLSLFGPSHLSSFRIPTHSPPTTQCSSSDKPTCQQRPSHHLASPSAHPGSKLFYSCPPIPNFTAPFMVIPSFSSALASPAHPHPRLAEHSRLSPVLFAASRQPRPRPPSLFLDTIYPHTPQRPAHHVRPPLGSEFSSSAPRPPSDKRSKSVAHSSAPPTSNTPGSSLYPAPSNPVAPLETCPHYVISSRP